MTSRAVDRLLGRGLVVALAVGLAQALVLALGWLTIYEHTHERVAASVEDVIVQSNVAAAEAVVDALSGLDEVGLVGSEDWETAQRVGESLELGGGGFACILDATGASSATPTCARTPGCRARAWGTSSWCGSARRAAHA